VNVKTDIEGLKTEVPHIVVGTPGRVLDLATKRNVLDLSHVSNACCLGLCCCLCSITDLF
jgi:superfamily II DNA/RNA helicase